MERESFEDEEAAEVLNRHFISIKVDREERPDIDAVYMAFCQAYTGAGGWPMSIFMTPSAKPFFAGTYFPKEAKYGRVGFITVLERLNHIWINDRHKLVEDGEYIAKTLKQTEAEDLKQDLKEDVMHDAFDYLKDMFEPEYGGFSSTPKFPSAHNLLFLLRYWHLYKDEKALEMVNTTLKGMYQGGIFDHIGFGFSRYSTDEKWFLPHFEKMLYDNALLIMAYLEAYQTTKDELYKDIAKKTLEYVNREMTSYKGAFFTAEDADSEGVEGKFYLWEAEEVTNLLGKEDGERFCNIFDITSKGNFEGLNIPNLINQKEFESLLKDEEAFIERAREKLFEYRDRRVHPYRDDKILVSWNALMISAFAMAARILNEDKYMNIASNAVEFIYNKMFTNEGRLLSRYRHGEASIPGFLDDYAFLAWSLIELFEASSKPVYLKRSINIAEDMIELFWDREEGGLFLYGNDAEELIFRPKSSYDGAIPSGNSAAAMVFFKLSRLTGDSFWEEKLIQILTAFGKSLIKSPQAHTFFIMSYLGLMSKPREVIIVGREEMKNFRTIVDLVGKDFHPFDQHIVYRVDEDLTDVIGFLRNYKTVDGLPTVYVCSNYSCQKPVTDLGDLERILKETENSIH